MKREEQIEKAAEEFAGINYDIEEEADSFYHHVQKEAFIAGAIYADAHPSNPYKDVIEHMSSNTYRVWKENLWHDAQGDFLPEIDREVIVLCINGKVCYGHRPNPDGWNGRNIITDEVNHYTPQIYDKGGWNIPDVKWWLDCKLPNMEEGQQ